MRLFDKVVSQCKATCVPLPTNKTVVLCADEIANHYATDNREFWGAEDYPYCIPPWDDVFVEWNSPRLWKMEKNCPIGHELGSVNDNGFYEDTEHKQFGMRLLRYGGSAVTRVVRTFSAVAMSKSELPVPEKSESVIWSYYFGSGRGVTFAMDVCSIHFLDSSGTVIYRYITGPGFVSIQQEMWPRVERMLDSASHISLLSFTFANCSNVKLEDVTEELQPEAKIRRRLRIPDVRRYTLNICGHVARPSRDYNEGPQGVMPFHLCRGHFATYTADRPMFGNPKLVGRYWHPPHMKGKKENGEIVKDYAIVG